MKMGLILFWFLSCYQFDIIWWRSWNNWYFIFWWNSEFGLLFSVKNLKNNTKSQWFNGSNIGLSIRRSEFNSRLGCFCFWKNGILILNSFIKSDYYISMEEAIIMFNPNGSTVRIMVFKTTDPGSTPGWDFCPNHYSFFWSRDILVKRVK